MPDGTTAGEQFIVENSGDDTYLAISDCDFDGSAGPLRALSGAAELKDHLGRRR